MFCMFLSILDSNCRSKALDILMKDLKIFAEGNEELFKEMHQMCMGSIQQGSYGTLYVWRYNVSIRFCIMMAYLQTIYSIMDISLKNNLLNLIIRRDNNLPKATRDLNF